MVTEATSVNLLRCRPYVLTIRQLQPSHTHQWAGLYTTKIEPFQPCRDPMPISQLQFHQAGEQLQFSRAVKPFLLGQNGKITKITLHHIDTPPEAEAMKSNENAKSNLTTSTDCCSDYTDSENAHNALRTRINLGQGHRRF